MKQTFNHGRLMIVIVHGFFNHKCCNTLPLISPLGSTKTSPRKLEKKMKKITILLIQYLEWQMKEQSFFKHICTQKNEIFHKMCFFFLHPWECFFGGLLKLTMLRKQASFNMGPCSKNMANYLRYYKKKIINHQNSCQEC